jgi:hypothetical protein
MFRDRIKFTFGDRTNFSIYDSVENYRSSNPDGNPIFESFLEAAIKRNGYAVFIDSVTGSNGEDISHLSYSVTRPGYVFGPTFKLGNTPEDKERGRAVANFIRKAEAAYEATKNSKLIFRANIC